MGKLYHELIVLKHHFKEVLDQHCCVCVKDGKEKEVFSERLAREAERDGWEPYRNAAVGKELFSPLFIRR